MEQVTKEEGRTILFVSHNLLTVQSLCKKTVLLETGKIRKFGQTDDVINTYLNERSSLNSVAATTIQLHERMNAGEIRFSGIAVSNTQGSGSIQSDDELKIVLNYCSDFNEPITEARIVVTIISERLGQMVLRLDSDVAAHSFGPNLKPEGQIVCQTDTINLTEGNYIVDIDFLIQGTSVDQVKRAAEFEVQTDINKYNYKTYPDKTICDYLIKYSFTQ